MPQSPLPRTGFRERERVQPVRSRPPPRSAFIPGGNAPCLTGVTAVTFGSTPALSFTVVSATQITAVAPPGPAGPVNVTVSTPGGTSDSLVCNRLGPPEI
ncbi:IPT/TIG domain-containing protein [Streptomyces sp. DSM 41534]